MGTLCIYYIYIIYIYMYVSMYVCARSSCAQGHELPQSHCDHNYIVFMIKPHYFERGNVGKLYPVRKAGKWMLKFVAREKK